MAQTWAALPDRGTDTVYGTQRIPQDDGKIFAYQGDDILSDTARDRLSDASAILISIPPYAHGCTVAKHIDTLLPDTKNLRWVGYLSTTSVYGDVNGLWVDETSPLNPTSDRAAHRVVAEQQWLDWGEQNDIPVQVFRLAGIYGPHSSPLQRIENGDGAMIHAPGHVFNRIHITDIARTLQASRLYPTPDVIYNISDDLPASQEDVMRFAYELMGRTPPQPIALRDAQLSAMACEFYRDCKRVCNEKIKNDLGIELIYPTYIEGLTALYKEMT